MSSIHITRRSPRSFAQITRDPNADSGSTSIAEDLRNTRRAIVAIGRSLERYRIGVDFTSLSNIRVTQDKVILFVKSAAQQNKLRQLLPRISTMIAEAGLRQVVEIKVRPVVPTIEERENLALGEPRIASEKTLACVEKAAEAIEDSPLKAALEKLAATMKKNRA